MEGGLNVSFQFQAGLWGGDIEPLREVKKRMTRWKRRVSCRKIRLVS